MKKVLLLKSVWSIFFSFFNYGFYLQPITYGFLLIKFFFSCKRTINFTSCLLNISSIYLYLYSRSIVHLHWPLALKSLWSALVASFNGVACASHPLLPVILPVCLVLIKRFWIYMWVMQLKINKKEETKKKLKEKF